MRQPGHRGVFRQVWRRCLRDQSGQHFALQYSLTFIIALATVIAMSVYIQRALKGRIRDAHHTMMNYVREENQALGGPGQQVYQHYEPYYTEFDTARTSEATEQQRLDGSPGLSTGIYTQTVEGSSNAQTTSSQLPPGENDQFGPPGG